MNAGGYWWIVGIGAAGLVGYYWWRSRQTPAAPPAPVEELQGWNWN